MGRVILWGKTRRKIEEGRNDMRRKDDFIRKRKEEMKKEK